MKNRGILILFTFILAACNSNQTKPVEPGMEYVEAIKAQSELMKQALLKSDFKAFIKFSYPKVVEMMGGDAKMIEALETSSKDMAAGGTVFNNVTLGEPSKTVKSGTELQCTIPQTIDMSVTGGKLTVKSTLIAISGDEGKTWSFLDTSGKDLRAMQFILPNLSAELVIPAAEEPVFTAAK
ncbi:MAG: hypothetical protein JWP12_1569 [Bacteroidetes bacterium]|nr:hypothetical protein [Bacteroidota bacterium]